MINIQYSKELIADFTDGRGLDQALDDFILLRMAMHYMLHMNVMHIISICG